jgi:guanylate kinase
MTPGPLIIVSGPAGSGKSTLIRRVLNDQRLRVRLAVSVTTRAPRRGEIDGQHYHFWTQEKFDRMLADGGFLEHARIHGQHSYGTPRSEVDQYLAQGIGVILDIDVQGAEQVRPLYPEHLSIFVKLSRWELYEQRLRQRRSETDESIARRLATAREELARIQEYQHVIVNDDLEVAIAEFQHLLTGYVSELGNKAEAGKPSG